MTKGVTRKVQKSADSGGWDCGLLLGNSAWLQGFWHIRGGGDYIDVVVVVDHACRRISL